MPPPSPLPRVAPSPPSPRPSPRSWSSANIDLLSVANPIFSMDEFDLGANTSSAIKSDNLNFDWSSLEIQIDGSDNEDDQDGLKRMETYVHDYYSVSKFRAAYEEVIASLTDNFQWPKVDLGFKMLPPVTKRSSGKPKKLRFKDCFERGGRPIRKQHKTCEQLGHRAAGCTFNGPKKRKSEAEKKAQSKEVHTPKKCRTGDGTTSSPGPMTRSRQMEQGLHGATPTRTMEATTCASCPGPLTRRQLALAMEQDLHGAATPPPRTIGGQVSIAKKLTPKRKKN